MEKEPYNDIDLIKCKFCEGKSRYDFCSENCQRAYWMEIVWG